MKKVWLILTAVFLSGCGIISPVGKVVPTISHDLAKYDFDALKKRGGIAGEIEISDEKAKNGEAKIFKFKSNGKWITGTVNYKPEKSSLSPAIIMIRGYAEKEGYYSGSGSWRMADQLAKEGYATFSIDFLGYAGSEAEASDGLEARFEKAMSVIDLIETIKALPWVDKNKIGIWAHSNGGQIALSALEITGKNYPTVLWAPMTNPFPQSLIDTADEGEDKQKTVDYVNLFLKYYDGRRYAFENYYSWIKAPVLILQGTKDVWCQVEWQEKVVKGLKSLGKTAELKIYEGNDHNLSQNWSGAVEESQEWFRKYLR